mgnify:CR=1 FL=1
MRFSSSTTKQLKHYVYALVDPRDESIFYVGKASANNRAFDHLRSSKGEEEKQKKIREIWEAGHQPEVEILRYGLDSAMASFEGLPSSGKVSRSSMLKRGIPSTLSVDDVFIGAGAGAVSSCANGLTR